MPVSLSAFLVAIAVATTTPTVATASTAAHRRLSYELIAGYEPDSQVTDHVRVLYSCIAESYIVSLFICVAFFFSLIIIIISYS